MKKTQFCFMLLLQSSAVVVTTTRNRHLVIDTVRQSCLITNTAAIGTWILGGIQFCFGWHQNVQHWWWCEDQWFCLQGCCGQIYAELMNRYLTPCWCFRHCDVFQTMEFVFQSWKTSFSVLENGAEMTGQIGANNLSLKSAI